MTPTLRRLFYSAGLLIVTPITYLWAYIAAEELVFPRDELALLVSGVCVAAAFVACWCAIWRPQAGRDGQRGRAVLLAVLVAGFVGVPAVLLGMVTNEEEAIVTAAIFWWGGWIAATGWLWSDPQRGGQGNAAAAPEQIRCPTCGYRMAGLPTARCPECGTQYTLDQLFAANSADPDL